MKSDVIVNRQGYYLEEYGKILGGDTEKEELMKNYFVYIFLFC